MKISVITVCLNAGRTIGLTLESFFRQRHPDKQLIVVDGGSEDDTLAVVRSFGTRRLKLIAERDDGRYSAANKGLAVYSGDAVGLLNADDCFADDRALAHIAGTLQQADIVFGNLDYVAGDSRKIVRRWRGTPHVSGAFRRGWMPAHPTFYVRRAVVDALGGFETRYRIAADYDFMLRALEMQNFRSFFIDRVLIEMMHGGESTSGLKAFVRHSFEALHSRQRWLGAGRLDYALFAKPLSKLQQVERFRLRLGNSVASASEASKQ